jgi:Rrf2 family transcriptional regulator, nitric oxide-sensitive transcriptional repressor
MNLMRLTSFTDYALRILLLLASNREQSLTISQVSDFFTISEAHLTKVVYSLGKSGWVETVRGRNGGMRLSVDPDQITLDKIVNYLEGEFAPAECFTASNTCRLVGRCGLETALARAVDAFNAVLASQTLGDAARGTVTSDFFAANAMRAKRIPITSVREGRET